MLLCKPLGHHKTPLTIMFHLRILQANKLSPVCPTCSNILTVSRVPIRDNPDAHLTSKNRFECRSCPYQYVLDKRYYERRTLKRKEVDDILGGADAWNNVDRTKGKFCILMVHYWKKALVIVGYSAAATRTLKINC
jgi:hypothetical protein